MTRLILAGIVLSDEKQLHIFGIHNSNPLVYYVVREEDPPKPAKSDC